MLFISRYILNLAHQVNSDKETAKITEVYVHDYILSLLECNCKYSTVQVQCWAHLHEKYSKNLIEGHGAVMLARLTSEAAATDFN